MSVNIPISSEIESKLRAHAAATGKDVDVFIREAIEEKLANLGGKPSDNSRWMTEFNSWMEQVASRGSGNSHPIDDSRESIYGDRGT